MSLTDTRRETLQARLKTLDGLLAGLDLDLKRIPKMLALLVLAVPAGIFASWVAVVFVVFSVLMLVSVSIYVTWGHQNEYRAERDLIRRELADGDRPRDALWTPPTPARPPPARRVCADALTRGLQRSNAHCPARSTSSARSS